MLTYKLMVAAPAMLTAIIAVQARTSADPFEMEGEWGQSERNLQAYVPLMKEAQKFNQLSLSQLSRVDVRYWARRWISGATAGQLKPLQPAQFGDSVQEGVKGQVFRASMHVVGGLNFGFQGRRDYSGMASDLLLATQVLQVLKFSDIDSLAYCTANQKHYIDRLCRLMPKLLAAQRAEIRTTLANIQDTRPAYFLAQRSRRQLTTHVARQSMEKSPLADTSRTPSARVANLDSVLQPTVDPVVVARALESTRRRPDGTDEQQLVAGIAYSYATMAELQKSLKSLGVIRPELRVAQK